MKISGASEREIAERFGVSQPTINKDVKIVLGQLADEHREVADKLRALYTARYERMLSALWDKAIGDPDNGIDPDLRAIDECRRILGNLAQIWGLNPKEPINVNVLSATLNTEPPIGLLELAREIYNQNGRTKPDLPALEGEFQEVEK